MLRVDWSWPTYDAIEISRKAEEDHFGAIGWTCLHGHTVWHLSGSPGGNILGTSWSQSPTSSLTDAMAMYAYFVMTRQVRIPLQVTFKWHSEILVVKVVLFSLIFFIRPVPLSKSLTFTHSHSHTHRRAHIMRADYVSGTSPGARNREIEQMALAPMEQTIKETM